MPQSLPDEHASAGPPTAPPAPRVLGASVRWTVVPTRTLIDDRPWFDELYVWTEGFQASTMQRARLQLNALRKAFALLEMERTPEMAVTLSFGTVERGIDQATAIFEANRLLAHRMNIMLRGEYERLRSPYRLAGFIDWLRTQHVRVGYWLTTAHVSAEMKVVQTLQPQFAKLAAPVSPRIEAWDDFLLETRVAGLDPNWLIVAGLESPAQKALALRQGMRFGQGAAVAPSTEPPSERSLRQRRPIPAALAAARRSR